MLHVERGDKFCEDIAAFQTWTFITVGNSDQVPDGAHVHSVGRIRCPYETPKVHDSSDESPVIELSLNISLSLNLCYII
jgi:hypothetical protein